MSKENEKSKQNAYHKVKTVNSCQMHDKNPDENQTIHSKQKISFTWILGFLHTHIVHTRDRSINLMNMNSCFRVRDESWEWYVVIFKQKYLNIANDL